MRLVFALVGAAMIGGCGYNCQETCNHVYADSECKVATGQVDENTAIRECSKTCQNALSNTGDIGDYDPYVPYLGGEQPVIENQKQAALWMECVWASAPDPGYTDGCTLLTAEEGFCAPI